jgi:hypothetical protein
MLSDSKGKHQSSSAQSVYEQAVADEGQEQLKLA